MGACLVTGVKTSTHLFIPNAQNTPSNILAFSGYVNEDNDYYFNDPLFPRIDEDPAKDLNLDSFSGIGTVDDDGDGSIDENDSSDDDEDGQNDEDKMDGIDNDGDGNIDEDPDNDVTGDGVAGIKGIDDDGDGSIDEGNFKDNDEDGNVQEDHLDALVYQYDSGTGTLSEWASYSGQTVVLSTRVTSFQVTYETPERIMVTLTLAGDQGEVVTFSEYIFIENAVQRLGKRVR